ncbi:unnamed protein product [Symbiodinium natans]|uniref:Peptidase S54 rhomboid domain-containing protein n=1 Tax=Symbiodinium natans TaxID=878477 RepID=A0A812L633_9DINO|nr:unnamed protein product [Symbiodinium natans]
MMPWGTFALASCTLCVHALEQCLRCRKQCSELFDFTGDALLRGRLWVLFSCSFFHGTNSHLLREVLLLLLVGVPAEEELGTLVFVVAYLVSGAFGALFSWLTLRRTLRNSPDYLAMPRHHVDAVADLSNSRGASSCVYGAAVLALLVAGDRLLPECFAMSSQAANALLVAARILPEVFSPRSSRIQQRPVAAAILLSLPLLAAYSSVVSLSVAQAVTFWFSIHCLLRLFPGIVSLHPQSEYAAMDYAGHVYGALYAGLCGVCHIYLNRRHYPSMQAWLALGVLMLSTLPREFFAGL